MKKIINSLLLLSTAALLFSACNKDPEKETDKSDKKAEFVSFGFYAEDNAILDKDYVAESIGREITLRLPEELDWSSLIARFTTSENDVVTVNEVEQTSGVTANDFTDPVDYLVSDSEAKMSTSYTVRVRKILLMKWEYVTSYSETGFKMTDSYQAKVGPDNNLYAIYTRTTEDEGTAGQKASVVKLDGDAFSVLGSAGFSAGRARMPAITINANGVPSVFFVDGANENFATAMTYSSGSWSLLGNAAFAGKPATSGNMAAMAYDPATNNPITFFHLNTAISGGLARRALDISYWEGSSWTADQTLADLTGKNIYNPFIVNAGNDLYMSCTIQGDGGGYAIFKYSGNKAWEKIDIFLPTGGTQANIVGMSMDVASDGTIYLLVGGDEETNGTWKPNLYRRNPSTGAWSRVATSILSELGRSTYFGMALDSNDSPVVVFRDTDNNDMPTMLTLDSSTGRWNQPVVLGSKASAGANPTVAFDANGVGYVMFVVEDLTTNYAFELYRYAMDTDE